MADCFRAEEQNVVEIQLWQQQGAPETKPFERVALKTAFSETIVLKYEVLEFPSLLSLAAVRFPAKPSTEKHKPLRWNSRRLVQDTAGKNPQE